VQTHIAALRTEERAKVAAEKERREEVKKRKEQNRQADAAAQKARTQLRRAACAAR